MAAERCLNLATFSRAVSLRFSRYSHSSSTCSPRAQRADEELRWDAIAGVGIDQREPVAEVDEALLPRPMRLAQYHGEALLEAPIQLGKLRVLVPFGVLGFVLLPEQCEGDLVVATCQLLAHRAQSVSGRAGARCGVLPPALR